MKYLFTLIFTSSLLFSLEENQENNCRIFWMKDVDGEYHLFAKEKDGHLYRINDIVHSWKCDCDEYMD